ncbi:hypothetical protein GCM10023093_05450 [Nemorincola caseinilytica]|uniref:Uncharacterized protein n=1 Tax=Nemorincola caseinilytica TaxID=2054315 RepID=A0ABP8N4J0_9BACT
MKRFVTSLLMVLYMAAAVGFSCSFHYCGGEYEGVHFTADVEKNCCGESEDTDGCCHTTVVSAKYKDDHAPSAFKVLLAKDAPALIPAAIRYLRHTGRTFTATAATGHFYKGPAPPLLQGIPLYLFIRVLRL